MIYLSIGFSAIWGEATLYSTVVFLMWIAVLKVVFVCASFGFWFAQTGPFQDGDLGVLSWRFSRARCPRLRAAWCLAFCLVRMHLWDVYRIIHGNQWLPMYRYRRVA